VDYHLQEPELGAPYPLPHIWCTELFSCDHPGLRPSFFCALQDGKEVPKLYELGYQGALQI